MTRVSDLPQLQTLTGQESILADVPASSGRVTIDQLLSKGAANYNIPISWNFPKAIAASGFQLYKDYLFGTAAAGTAPVIPVTSTADLTFYFNPQADAVGTAVQNEEVERFTAFGSGNHVFTTNSLILRAALESGGAWDVVPKNLTAALTSGQNTLQLADTNGISRGQVFASSASSIIPTGASVISQDATSVTFNNFQNFTLPNNASIEFLPVFTVGASPVTSQSLITVPSGVPQGVIPGMFYTNITGGTFGIRRVVSVPDSTHIQLDGNVSIGTSNLVMFQPPVTSGQMWTKEGFQPGKTCNGIAFELTCKIPQSSPNQNGASRGAWPAQWLYSHTSEGNSFDASEIDIFEFFESLTAGSNAYTSNIHGGLTNVTDYQLSVGSGSNKWDSSGFFRGGTDYGLTTHRFQLIWLPDKVYRYIDDALLITNKYIWSSQCTAQYGLDLACGSFISAFMGIYFYPRATSQFPMDFVINEIKIWTF